MLKVIARFLPMRWDGDGFWDVVSNEKVDYWREVSGRRVMATGRFSLFRVETVG